MTTAAQLVEELALKGLMVTTAESCTGGQIAAALTAVAGSSRVFDRGFVTYSNSAKTEMLGVPSELIEASGAVSEVVAVAMAKGALAHSKADVAVAVTGIAGPDGGTALKPVGLVHFAVSTKSKTQAFVMNYGSHPRQQIQTAAVATALELLRSQLDQATA
jgi:nicotinamide-nucleotide amidase